MNEKTIFNGKKIKIKFSLRDKDGENLERLKFLFSVVLKFMFLGGKTIKNEKEKKKREEEIAVLIELGEWRLNSVKNL